MSRRSSGATLPSLKQRTVGGKTRRTRGIQSLQSYPRALLHSLRSLTRLSWTGWQKGSVTCHIAAHRRHAMKRPLLFVQGGGASVHDEWDNHLVDSLSRALGTNYQVHYPR